GTRRVGRAVVTAAGTFAGVVSFEPAAYVSVPVANSQTRPITAMRGTIAAKRAAIPSASAADGAGLSLYRVNRITPAEVEARLGTRLEHDAVGKRVEGRALRRRDVGGRVVVMVMRDGNDRGAAANREDVARVVGDGRREQRAGSGCRRRALRLGARLRERAGRLPQPGAKPSDPNRGRVLANADERRGFLETELPGQKLRALGPRLPAALLLRQRPLDPQRREELPVRLGNVLASAVQRDLEPVELEGRIEPAAAERVREL